MSESFNKFSHSLNVLTIDLVRESRFEQDFFVPPQCVLELGLIEFYQINGEEAKMWLKKAIKDYSGYLTENFVHLRAYAALRDLGVSTDKDEDPNKSETNIKYLTIN